IDNIRKKVREHVDKLAEDYVLGASEDDLVGYLVQEFSLKPITLGKPFIASSQEMEVDVSHDPLRRSPFGNRVHVKGLQVHVKVPYVGDGTLFWFRPSHFTLSMPRATVTKDHLEFYIQGEHLVGETVRQSLDATIGEIRGY